MQGQQDLEEGKDTESSRFYRVAAEAEAAFADELVTRALAEDSTREVLDVLKARNAAWGRREDYERRRQQEEAKNIGPAVIASPLGRALVGVITGIIGKQSGTEGRDWSERKELDQLREAHSLLTADIERREQELADTEAAA